MSKVFAILFAVVLAAVCSQPLMSALKHVVLPGGHQLRVTSVSEVFYAHTLFELSVCTCAGLAVAAGCYLKHYSLPVRWTVVLLPMLCGAFLVTILKVVQFQHALSVAEKPGIRPAFSLRQASLHLVPAAAFVAGLAALTVAFLIRRKNGEQAGSSRPRVRRG